MAQSEKKKPLREQALLDQIRTFQAEHEPPMADSYFGKEACGNSELVARLQANGRVWPDTKAKIVAFMAKERSGRSRRKRRRTGQNTSACTRNPG